MVKVLEGKHRGTRKCGGRGRGGLAGLARLRHECHRFREEVVCIRTFPRLQLRWPSLARLEIGNESSEEDASSVWDAAEAEGPDTLFVSRETERVAEACPGNVVEFSSPKAGPLPIASKADESTSDEKLGGFEEKERSLQDAQSSQKMDDVLEFTLRCEDGAGTGMCCNSIIEEDALEPQGPSDGTSESKMAHQMLELRTTIKETSDPSDDGSLMDSLKGQTLNTVHTHSGARIAATALFTANPHYNSHEIFTACSPNCNFTCESEGFKLVAFPGSNASDNASHKEREVWSEQVLCSSSESHICSSSELNGYATVDKRTSTPIETNSLEVGYRTFDESSQTFQAGLDRRLLPSLHLVAPSCGSDVDYQWDSGQAKIGLKGSETCVAPVHGCHFLTRQDRNVLDNVQHNGLAIPRRSNLEDYGMLTSLGGKLSRTAVDYVQSMNMQGQYGLAKGKQKHEILSTGDCAGGRRSSTTFISGLAQTSKFPPSSSLQHHSSSPLFNETGPPNVSKKQGSGVLGLISLSDMKNFARLGVGSTRDSVMTAQMAKRIKHALERLGDVGIRGCRHRKSVSITKGKWTDEIYAKRKNKSEATSESTVVKSDLKRFRNPDELLAENSESKWSESHVLRENDEQKLGHGQITKQKCEAKSLTPEEPDLYLQSIIAALDSACGSDDKDSTLNTSTSATGLQMDQHCPTQGRDGGVSTKLFQTYANGTSLTTLGEVFKSHATKDCVADSRILHTTDVAMPDSMLEEKFSADYVNSIRELISRPYHTEETQDTVVQVCGVSKKSNAHANGSPSSTPDEVFECDSDKDGAADHRIVQTTNVERADTFLQEKHPAIDECSMGKLIPHPLRTDEEPSAKVGTEDLPAFTVKINAPRGSCFQVEVGGHSTVYGEVEEASQQVLGNPITYPPSPSGRQGKFNVRVAHRKSRLLQQRSLQHAPSTRQEIPAGPINYDSDPLSASNKVEEGRQTKQSSLSLLELSPPVVRQDDSMSAKYSPTLRPSTQENLRHSFDQKITSLVKKANQLQEEKNLPGTSTHGRRSSVCCRRQLEVIRPKRQPDPIVSTKVSDIFRDGDCCYEGQGPTKCIVKRRDRENKGAPRATQSMVRSRNQDGHVRRAQRPSLLKSTVNTKLLRLGSYTCANHRDSQAAETATKMEAFGAAAAGLAHELNVLIKDRRSRENLESRAPNKRKVVWASPEAYELGPIPTVKPSPSQSGMQSKPSKDIQSTQHSTTHSKSVWNDYAAPSATQTVCDVRTTKEHRKGPVGKQCKAPRRPQLLQKNSVSKNSEIYDAVSASPFSEFENNQVSQESGLRSEQKQSEGGETRAKEVKDASTGETFDYDQFRQELKDLHVERIKLENLVQTIFTTDADPKCPDSTVESARRDPCLEDHDKRKGLGLSPNRDSGKNGSHHAADTGVRQREFEPSLSWVTLSDDLVGNKVTRNSHTQVDRKTCDRLGCTLEEEEIKRTPSAAFRSGEALNCDRKDVPIKCQRSLAGSDIKLQGKDQNIGFNREPESETHMSADLGFLSKDVLLERFPNLNSILAGEDAMSAPRSASAVSKMEVVQRDYFKEYLLQALDSSVLLLQHCVNQSEELQDLAISNRPESSNMYPSTDLVTILHDNCNVQNCTEGLLERTTEVNVADHAIIKVPASQNEPDHSQEHVNKLGPNVQWLQQDVCYVKDGDEAYQQMLETRLDPRKSVVPSQQALESGEPQVENMIPETWKGIERSQESDSKVSSSEKGTSWSGSVKSVMEAYKEAQRSAAFLISASPKVHESNVKAPSSYRSERGSKLQGAEKPRLRMEETQKRKEKVSPLTLLEKADKAEAKELQLRSAQKKYMKSRQNSLRSTGLGGGKEKLQGRSRKHHSGREQWKVPKVIYRTAESGKKGRDDWNDSTEISYDKYGTGWNSTAKEVAQALITKALNEELVRKQRRPGMKHLKPIEVDLRRKRKDFVNLESYASTVAQMRGREKSSLTKGNPPFEDKREAEEVEGIQDNVHAERSTPQFSMERNATDRVNYFTISRNLRETENHVLDESTMVFKRSREYAGQLNSGSGANLMNQDVRESIEHWLDTSGGFEFLDSYNEAVEDDMFERQESTNSMQRNVNKVSIMTGLSERILSDEACPSDKLSTSRTTVLERIGKSRSGDLGSVSSTAKRDAIQCSWGKREECPHRLGASHEDDHAGGSSTHSSLKMDKSSLGCNCSISKGSGSDQIVRVLPSQEPAHKESIHSGENLLYSKDIRRLGGSRCPSQVDYIACEDAHAMAPKFDVNGAHSDPLSQGTDVEEKWTEEEELELALLEIVLRTILKDDPLSETVATMTCGLPSEPAKRGSNGSSVTPTIACTSSPCSVLPALTGAVTPMSTYEKGLRSGVHLDQGVQTSIPDIPSLAFSTLEHGGDSAKSSGGDWPDYKCLAEMQSGSQSLEEDGHWPEYNGVDEVEDGVDRGTHIEELPFDQISTPSTSEMNAGEKLPGRSLPPRAVAVSTMPSTRPPYSAVHSIRAAERQSIDFPGIASLAFGYPSPRPPPPSKPIGQTSVDKSSVSVQTADMSMTQSAPLSTSICVVPFYYLPPYSVILPPSPLSGVPSPASTVPITVAGQPGSQFIASLYGEGAVPIFPPQYMFPPSAPFPQVVSQATVMPVAPVVQSSQQTPVPSCAVQDAQTTVSNPPSPLSSLHRSATEGPSQPSIAVKLAPTSTKETSSHPGKIFVGVVDSSHSSSDSCRSSLATPSTILSSPEHESRVASALARPSRIARGIVGHLFDEGSSDDAEACGREEIIQTKQDGGTQQSDQGTHLPPSSTTIKEADDPLLQSIIAEKFYKQSRGEIAPALLPTHVAGANEFILNQHAGRSDQPESGTTESVDSARSSVLVASYDGSGSSEGSVKRTRCKASGESSDQSSLDGFRQFKRKSTKPARQVGFSQTSSRSSGEILDACGVSLHGLDENKELLRHRSSHTLPLSEGEVEAGQLPSEGEYFGPIPRAWRPHPRLLVNRHISGRDTISEPGEICKQALMQLQPPRSEIGANISILSEGELRMERSTESSKSK